MIPTMFWQQNIMVLDFNPGNISLFQLHMEYSPWLWAKGLGVRARN